MRQSLLALTLLAGGLTAGCNILENDVQRGYEQTHGWSKPTAERIGTTYTTADIRVITQRPHPLDPSRQVICTEPSPDVAKALSTAAQLSASGTGQGVGANVTGAGGSAEAVAALAGRSTALLGLRDGLFQACQAYANGAIGDAAYALVLSRYGQLMTTLFLGQDITGAAGTAPGVTIQSNGLITVTSGSTSTSNIDTTPQLPAPKAGTGTSGTNGTQGNAAPTGAPNDVVGSIDSSGSGGAGTAGGKVAGRIAQKVGAPAAKPATKAAAENPQVAGEEQPVPDSAAGDLRQMNKDYFDIDKNMLHLMVVSCINEFDMSRADAAGGTRSNTWLRDVCTDVEKRMQQDPAMLKKILTE